MTLLQDVVAWLGEMPGEEKVAVAGLASKAVGAMKWVPSPGPQTEAYLSPADILLYGGQGGGGKSDLGLGLAFTAHRRSLILRRRYVNLVGLTDRALEINGTREGYNASPPPKLKTTDGRDIHFGANQHAGDEQQWQGQPYDLKFFDEACHFLESQIRFHIGWMRSADTSLGTAARQRVRVVLGSNPPVDADGDWLVKFFRPWLDITHENPAKPGELRWYVTAPDGSDLEVDGPQPVQMDGRMLIPMSRSFIPAALKDNPFLIDTDYQAKLDGLPEPLRSAIRDGNFMAARVDADRQVIPMAWIIAAQQRWQPDGYKKFNMTALAIDPAGGGADACEIACRHGGWYSEPRTYKGQDTADGGAMAAQIVKHRRDACPVIVDVGGGYGGAVMLRLKDNGITCSRFDGGAKAHGQTKDGSRLRFANKRAEAWWRMREELNPEQVGGSSVSLPPDPELRQDLAAPTWELSKSGILLEPKDDLRKRLGRSPGKGDAFVMCLSEGVLAERRQFNRPSSTLPQPIIGYSHLKKRRF